jgi:hypothetical protein
MLLVSQSRHIVNRFADGADGSARGERERRRGAVHANKPSRGLHQWFEIASVDEVQAVGEACADCLAPHEFSPVEKARIQRVRLEKQVIFRGGISGKAFDHISRSALHVRER